MKFNKNIVLGNTLQLIQINKDIRNFKSNITLESVNEDDVYYILVTTQRKLDESNNQMDFKKIDHYINIDVENNNNKHENFILVMKSDSKVRLSISIDIEDNDKKQKDTSDKLKSVENFKKEEEEEEEEEDTKNNYLKYGMYVLIILIICGLGYYYFVHMKKPKDTTGDLLEKITENEMKVDLTKSVETSTLAPSAPEISNDTLLDKLRKIREN